MQFTDCLQLGFCLRLIGLVQRSAATGTISAFIMWTQDELLQDDSTIKIIVVIIIIIYY